MKLFSCRNSTFSIVRPQRFVFDVEGHSEFDELDKIQADAAKQEMIAEMTMHEGTQTVGNQTRQLDAMSTADLTRLREQARQLDIDALGLESSELMDRVQSEISKGRRVCEIYYNYRHRDDNPVGFYEQPPESYFLNPGNRARLGIEYGFSGRPRWSFLAERQENIERAAHGDGGARRNQAIEENTISLPSRTHLLEVLHLDPSTDDKKVNEELIAANKVLDAMKQLKTQGRLTGELATVNFDAVSPLDTNLWRYVILFAGILNATSVPFAGTAITPLVVATHWTEIAKEIQARFPDIIS